MSIANELKAVIEEMAAPSNFGTTVTINGVVVPAIVSDAAYSVEYISGLMLEGVDVIVVVPKKYIGTKPKTTSTLQISGTTRRILKVEDEEAAWTLVCASATS